MTEPGHRNEHSARNNKKGGRFNLFSLLLAGFFLTSCATDISRLPIQSHKIHVRDAEGGLIPRKDYKIDFSFRERGAARLITNIEESSLRIFSLDRKIRVSGTRITPLPFDFALVQDPFYTFEVKIRSNSYRIPPLIYPVRWDEGTQFIFEGPPEKASTSGHGVHGRPGPELKVEAAWYDVSGTPLEGTGSYLLVHERDNGVFTLVREEEFPILISAKGGRGGKGAQGKSAYLEEGQQEVYGRPGYDGGDGGQGGRILLVVPAAGMDKFFDLQTEGGDGGEGGLGGRGESRKTQNSGFIGFMNTLLGVNFGESGRKGRPGNRGDSKVEIQSLDALFPEFYPPGFERSRLSAQKP